MFHIAPEIDASSLLMTRELLDLTMDGSAVHKIVAILCAHGVFVL